MDSLKTDMFESTLEGTDCEFCLQHPIFGFFFFVNKKKLFFSNDLGGVFRVCAVYRPYPPSPAVSVRKDGAVFGEDPPLSTSDWSTSH